MRLQLVILSAAALFTFTAAQTIDELIKEVFPGPGEDTGTTGTTATVKDANVAPQLAPEGDGCTCVAYYLCNNGTVNPDGTGVIDIGLTEDGCDNYLDICCKDPIKVDPDNPITVKPPIDKPTGCGSRNPDGVGFRITGDNDNKAQFAEFPWMVAIFREEIVEGYPNKFNVYQCGGALIHPSVVLTAAHCVDVKDKVFKVRAGEWDIKTTREILPHQIRQVKNLIIHEEYFAKAAFNDVALMILDEPVEIAGNVDVICLPPTDIHLDKSRCFASGWGKDVFGKEGKYQGILKKVELPIVNRDVCQNHLRQTRLGKLFQLHKSFICAGGEVGKDTCRGDGGSPLVCPIPGHAYRYFQAGIVAWGIGCGDNQVPSVYVNIPLFRPWIDEMMKTNGYETSTYTY